MLPPSIIHYINIHGLGREGCPEIPGLLHGVVDQANTREFYRIDLKAAGLKCNELSTEVKITH